MANRDLHREETLESRLLLWAADWLTALLLSVGMVLPCLDAYGVSGRHGFDLGAVLAFCIFGSLAATAVFTWRHGYWAALAVAAAGGLVFWRLWAHMAAEWHVVRDPGLSDLLEQSPGALFLLYALVVMTLGWVVVRVRVWWLAAALVVLPILPAIQSGVLPSWGAMLAGFAGWGAMLLTDLFNKNDRGSLARARFLSLGGMAALLLLLVITLPMEGYTRPQWATEARTGLIRGMNRQLERFFDPEDLENNLLAQLGLDLTVEGGGTGTGPGQSGGLSITEVSGTGMGRQEDLLLAGPRRYTGRLLLSVATDQPNPAGRMYLRGGSFSRYTGTSWESAGTADSTQPEAFPPLTAPDMPSYTLRVRDTGFQGTWYYPYRYDGEGTMDGDGRLTLERDEDAIPLEDLASISNLEGLPSEEYRVTYRPGGPEDGFTPLSGSQAAEEEAYRYGSAAFWETLYLPGDTADVLPPLVEEIQREAAAVDERLPEQYRETVAAAARTASWLASVAAYDPDTPAMEEGDDFVTHFLEEGRGFCVHFATAGTMLLRAQGIPARYVNGYVVQLDGQGRGTVRDSDAHAWVEIYLEGYGWYPVEMTPGYTGGLSGAGLEGAVGSPETEEPDSEAPEEDETPEDEAPGEETPDDEQAPEDEALPEEEVPEETEISVPWKILFGIAVFWAVFCMVYLLALLVRRRERGDRDANRSVLCAYGRYKRLRRWGCGEDDELERLAKKAKFSQHTLTEEERESAWKCLDEDVKQSRIGQPVRRRWLFALLCPIF